MPPASSNPYDSVILPLVGEETKAKAGGYDAIIPKTEAQDPAMRASVSLAVGTDPAQFAEQRRNAKTAGLPPAAGPALPDETKRLATVDTIVKDTQDTPVLRQRYTDADFAKLSHTDSGVLSSIEKTMGKGLAFVMGANPEANLPDIVHGAAHWMAEGAAGVGRAGAGLATYFPGPLDLLPGGNPFARLEEGFAMANQAERKKRLDLAAEWGDTWQGRVFGGGLESGIQSAVQNLPLAAGTAALIYFGAPVAATVGASLLAMSAIQGGQSYGETLDKGAGKGTALIHGLADTMAEYVGEKYWGFAGFMSNALAGASLTKLAVYEVSKELPGEIGTTIWQNFNEWAANNKTKPFMDFVKELPESIAQTVVATLVGGGGQIAATHYGRGLLAEAARTAGLTDQASAGADHLERLFDRAKESTLRKNDADTFKDLIQAIAEGNEGAIKSVHVDAQSLVEMSLAAGISQEVFNQLLPSAGPQMQEALASNGSVELPIGEVVANIPGSKLEPGFIDNVRVTPEALTRAEAAQTSEQAQTYWQSRADEVLKAAENAQKTADSAEKVGKNILDQLTATKRFTAEVARRYADLHKAFFTVMADRLGITPEEAFQKYPLKVLSTLTNGQAYADNSPRRKPGEITVEGVHYSKEARNTLSGAMYGTNIAGSGKEAFLNAKDERLRKRIYFYANKGTGINPEAGVGAFAHKANLTNIYDANSDPLRLRKGDQQAFESAVLDRGYSGYLDRLEGTQSAQVILLGDQNVPVTQMGALQKAEAAPVPAPAPRESKGRDIIIDALAANKALPAGSPTVERWQQILPEDIKQALADAGVFDGDQQRPMYKSELAAAYAARTEAPVYDQKAKPAARQPTFVSADVARVADISAARVIAKSKRWGVNRAFKIELQNAVRAVLRGGSLRADNPATREYLVSQILKEAREALITNPNAVGWYDDKVTTALEIVSILHPELKTDEQARFAFTWALAVTSNGVKVDKNFELAERAYTHWKNSNVDPAKRRMPTSGIGVGPAAGKIHNALRTYNRLLNDWGFTRFKSFATTLQSNRAVEAAFGRGVSGEGKDTQVYGAGIVGPKIGNGFFMNLYGEFGQLTMDRWWVRMWGRLTGDLVETDKKKITESKNAVVKMIDLVKADPEAKRAAERALGFKLSKGDPKGIATQIARASAKEEVRDALALVLPATPEREAAALAARGTLKDFVSIGDELRKSAVGYLRALDGQIEVPGGSRRRDMMREVSARVLAELQKEHPNLTMADFQALMWYPEKTLYDTAGAVDEDTDGYEDDEAPDYANAAAKLAKTQGVKDEQITAAIGRARSAIEARQRARSGGRATGSVQPPAGNGAGATPAVLQQQGAAGPVLLNVGLDVPAGGTLTPAEVQSAIEAFGVKVETSAVHQSNTEQTFVGQLDRALTPDEADALSRALGQEAVVQMVGNEGALYGPEKAKWGDFNPDYFLTLDGSKASEVLHQSAFHGTPHRGITKFDTSKIGTGEGAQAYGWGLYFASKKEIAEHYRKILQKPDFSESNLTENGKRFLEFAVEREARDYLNKYGKEIQTTNPALRQQVLNSMSEIYFKEATGQLYEVDIPEDSELLLWDKPLSEQPEKVREALKQVGVSFPAYALDTKRASSDFYLYLSDKLGSDKAASETLLAAGVRGIKYLDGTSRRAGAGSYNYVVFSGDDVAIKNQFYQNKPDPLGTFKPSTLEISLLADANLSTFLHETGHFFLEVLGRVANEPGAPKEIVDDLNATLKWFGVKDIETWNAMSFDEREPYHEKWAESFERYLLEGKAPSLALRSSFQRFKEFMLGVYKSLKQFITRHPNAKINDEIRSVFDRLLATEEQIKEAEAQARFEEIFKSAKDAGMTEEEWKAYQEKHQDATQAALEKMGKLSLADTKWFVAARSKALREAQAAVADKRAEMKAQVTAEVMALPVEQARAEIANLRASTPEQKAALKTWNEARAAALAQAKEQLTAALVAANPDAKGLGKGQLLAKNKRAIANQAEAKALEWEQSHPRPKTMPPPLEMEVLAERLGYTSADQLRREMIEAPAAKDLIEAMTDQRLLETYGNLVTREGIEQAANEAVYNEARGRFVATELGAMQDAMSKTGPSGKTNRAGKPINVNVITQAARTFAEAVVNRRRIMDLKPAQHTAAAARAAGKAARLQAEGKTAEAIAAKRDQLLSHFTALFAFRAEKDVASQLAYLKKFDKEGVRKSIPQDYLDQIDALLERVDLRKGTSAKEIARRQDLAKWVEQQHEEGKSPILPPAALANSQLTSYKEMTVEDFAGLVDSIQNIEHLGRLKGKLLKSADKRAWDAIATEIADTIRKFGGKAKPDSLEPRGKAAQLASGFWADHRKLDSLAYQMDGGQINGPMFRAFIRGMNDSGAYKASEIAKATQALAAIYEPVWALPGGTAGDLKFIPEINNSLTRGGRLSVVLNWGNAENRQRLLETGVGAPWSQAQVEAIMRTLSPTELQFVNNVWEFLDSFWPAIKAKQQRVSGVVEEKVEAVPFDVVASDGTTVHMRGGYYPIVYDNDRSNAAAKRDAMQIAKDMLRGAIGAATTRRGHTKARVEEVKAQPLRLSLNVITQHVEQVVHDLAWHEWLIDANKILADKRIAAAIREHYGPAILKTMKANVDGIATGDVANQTALDQILLGLRSNVSRAVMGFSLTTGLLQPFGVMQSISRVGLAPVLKGAGRWAGDAARMESTIEWVNEKSDFMRLRAQTMNREINDISQRVKGKSKAAQIYDHSIFFLTQKMQLVADIPTWVGMYERAQAEGFDEATSVALADEAVKASQGGGQTQDLANIQRSKVGSLFTMFYGYFSTTVNIMAEKTATTDFKSPLAVAGWLADMTMLAVLPAILPNMLIYAMRGGDDDDPESWAKRLAKWQAAYMLGLFVGVRELSGITEGYDYAGPPVLRVVVDTGKAAKQLMQGELDEAAVASIARVMGDIFGIPSTQLIRSYRGWQAWADGDAPVTAVLMGPPPRD